VWLLLRLGEDRVWVMGALAIASYGGAACSVCVVGYYRLAATCVPCPKQAYMLVFAYVFVMGTWTCASLLVYSAESWYGVS
jgi:hypothetical protein